ncbi:hypothetical protein AGOR_G00093190 [Albula goreensis]|uniref:VWFA domain-containing protein n=1 Tax=Albula goreensis TaxID=1534307 RepID=A0A8T3DIM0_9TELE|nr:hypothetical protein AGOR_G00093190 [Albula goreensis]
MEFACEFVYVPPLPSQPSGQKPKQNAIKRSALLPPLKILRPSSPPPPPPQPPPPPASSEQPRTPSVTSPEKRIMGHVGATKDPKATGNKPPVYENVAIYLKEKSSNPVPEVPDKPQTSKTPSTAVRKALLPPPMRVRLDNQLMTPPTHVSGPLKCPHSGSGPLSSEEQELIYDLPKEELETEDHPFDPEYSYSIPECSGREMRDLLSAANSKLPPKSASAPPLPPRPSFMKRIPTAPVDPSAPVLIHKGPQDSQPLPGNPNVILAKLGNLVTEENVHTMEGMPTSCSQCGSALESCYDNMVNTCHFCQSWDSQLHCTPMGCEDCLFLMSSDETATLPAEPLLIFCIDISGSMCITSQVTEDGREIYMSRLQCVQHAVLQCVHFLSEREPHTRVGLITFNNQVTLHGHGQVPSRFLQGAELIDSDYLREAVSCFPSPPRLSESRQHLEEQVHRLAENGATALGPAIVVAIEMASRQPGSKVVICTDGKANTELGNLDVDDSNSHVAVTSTIFYQDMGEYAANQGVSVSVMTIEGTDCRLDELGRLADRTGGKVVIASPDKLCIEFQQLMERKVVATHCSVTILLPTTLTVKGEREPGHKAIRKVGNVTADKEITFQFRAREEATQALLLGGHVSMQLQVRYRRMDGQTALRVLSVVRKVTDDSSLVLSSLSLPILQLNSSQGSAALAVRGRYRDAQREGETQRQLMERALNHFRNSEEKQQHRQWVETMDPIYNSIYNFTRSNCGSIADTQSLTDTGAALFYGMKNDNRRSISLKGRTKR